MNIGFALEYIPQQMDSYGWRNNYLIFFRHLQIAPNSELEISADNEWYYLIGNPEGVKVRSKLGEYDLDNGAIDEMQYEHTTQITITNKSYKAQLIEFIQVTPKHSQQKNKHG